MSRGLKLRVANIVRERLRDIYKGYLYKSRIGQKNWLTN